ncbi:unnamed protein product [Eretmochelys imbricata]
MLLGPRAGSGSEPSLGGVKPGEGGESRRQSVCPPTGGRGVKRCRELTLSGSRGRRNVSTGLWAIARGLSADTGLTALDCKGPMSWPRPPEPASPSLPSLTRTFSVTPGHATPSTCPPRWSLRRESPGRATL